MEHKNESIASHLKGPLLHILCDSFNVFLKHSDQTPLREIMIHVTGFDQELGVSQKSVKLHIDSMLRKVTISDISEKTVNTCDLDDKQSFESTVKDHLDLIIKHPHDKFNVNKMCVSYVLQSDDTITRELMTNFQQEINDNIRHCLLNEVKCRHKRGPRLDNKEILWSHLISKSFSLSFIHHPMYVERSIELLGLQ